MSEDFDYEEFDEEDEFTGAVAKSTDKTLMEKSAGISSSTILHIIIVALLVIFVKYAIEPEKKKEVEAQYIKPQEVEKIEEIKEMVEEVVEDIEPTENFNFQNNNPVPMPSPLNQETTTQNPDVSPDVPTIMDNAPSTVKLPGLFASRSGAGRLAAITQFGGGGTDNMVYRALEWLRDNQEEDGSWAKVKPAMTGFGLLAFLAYGQTPSSQEFGPTVAKAIDWLAENFQEGKGSWPGLDGHHYAHAIATYAVSEAYAMTRNPSLKYIMEEATGHIIDGTIVQHVGRVGSMKPVFGLDASGDNSKVHAGWWDYNYKNGAYPKGYENGYSTDDGPMRPRLAPANTRKDNSFVGFQLQALKAAKAAKCNHPKIDEAIALGVNGVKHMQGSNGSFFYSHASPEKKGGGGKPNQLGVGSYTLQLLEGGYEKSPEVMKSLEAMKKAGFDSTAGREFYRIYYLSNASYWGFGYQRNQPTPNDPNWVKWNNAMKKYFKETQNKDGSWTGNESSDGIAHTTALGALSLMVYYRNLPGSVGADGAIGNGGAAAMATQRKPEFKAKLIDTNAAGDDDGFEEF